MAKTYRVSAGTRLVDHAFTLLTRLGLGKRYRYVLTVPGRRTGTLYSTPVDVMHHDDRRWLVAAYGVSNWVHNARAAGQVTLSRGGRSQTLRITEQGADDSIPVLRQYLHEVPITRPYFDVTPDSPDRQFAAEAHRHPVFELIRADDEEQIRADE
jgi:deazaflavin-dependent oxidoreductase (nitroreductase family)